MTTPNILAGAGTREKLTTEQIARLDAQGIPVSPEVRAAAARQTKISPALLAIGAVGLYYFVSGKAGRGRSLW